jgi:putative ABC transport system substrate-binding protein
MRRREFIAGLGAVAAWPRGADAQQSAMRVVGYLGAQARSFYDDRLRAFHEGFGETGFREGRETSFEYRWAEGHVDRFPTLLSDLVARRAEVIALPDSTAAAVVAKRMITTIPIVFGLSVDPIQLGLVASWSQPGGNLTGMVLGNSELVPKRMEFLHQLAPQARTVGLLVNPDTSGAADMRVGQSAARALGLELRILDATDQNGIATAVESLAREQRPALLVGSDTLFYVHREWLAGLAARHALVAIYDRREYVQAAGLISYGANLLAFHRQMGVQVGRILKGEKPANLPVMLPTKFEMAVNLDAARKLNLSLPASFLALADEVIE